VVGHSFQSGSPVLVKRWDPTDLFNVIFINFSTKDAWVERSLKKKKKTFCKCHVTLSTNTRRSLSKRAKRKTCEKKKNTMHTNFHCVCRPKLKKLPVIKNLTSTALITTAQTHKQASDSTRKYYRRTSSCLINGLFLNNNFKFRKSTPQVYMNLLKTTYLFLTCISLQNS
jgi:hypothetical protein